MKLRVHLNVIIGRAEQNYSTVEIKSYIRSIIHNNKRFYCVFLRRFSLLDMVKKKKKPIFLCDG